MKTSFSKFIAQLKRQIKRDTNPKGKAAKTEHARSIEARVFPRNARRSALAADIEAANFIDRKKPL